jgi:uncharacterized protein
MSDTNVVEVKQAIADPSSVGLASFGIALFTLSFTNAGILGANAQSVITPLALFVGLIHFFAALNGFKKNELFTALVFGIYGMFWATYGLINLLAAAKVFTFDAQAFLVFLVAYTIFTVYVLIASLVTNRAVILTLAALLVVFLLLDLGLAPVLSGGAPNGTLVTWAGYIGIIDALLAFYLSAAALLEALHGRSVLPVGPVQKAAPIQRTAPVQRAA